MTPQLTYPRLTGRKWDTRPLHLQQQGRKSQVKSYSLHLQGRKKIEYDLVRRSFARYPPSNVSSISLYVLILRGHRIYITRSYLICTTSLAIIHEAIASGLPNARGAWFWLTSWAPNTKLETIGPVFLPNWKNIKELLRPTIVMVDRP
ncbi:hypothetical protein EDD85DRAFT_931994 [Armillaria nabsnona]|nr:hypothetical protein EDD85DRAFT_931994 [Armillaria nabsnona]